MLRTSVPSRRRSSAWLDRPVPKLPPIWCDHSRSPFGRTLASSGLGLSLYHQTGTPSALNTTTYGRPPVPEPGVSTYHCCDGVAFFVNVHVGKSVGRQRTW